MRPSEVFGIVIRVFGLSMTVYSLWSLASSIALSFSGVDVVSVWYVISAVAGLVLGIYFLKGAPLVLHFSYPHER